MLQGSAGRKDYWLNQFNTTNIPQGRYAVSWTQWENPWAVTNPDGIWPRLAGLGNNVTTTSFWLDDLSYLRVKNIQLGYNLPKKWLTKLTIDNLRIYASGENLATFTKFRGLDPERMGNASDMYPLNKSYSIGINLGF